MARSSVNCPYSMIERDNCLNQIYWSIYLEARTHLKCRDVRLLSEMSGIEFSTENGKHYGLFQRYK